MSAPDRIATTLAALAHGLHAEDVPEAVSLRARHLILDAIGCALASRREDYAARFLAAARALADGLEDAGVTSGTSVTSGGGRGLIGYTERLPLRDSAMMNGVLAHGLDYDDTHMAGVIHLTVSVLPAVLAVGAARRVSGGAMLTAYIAGVEAGARIASVVKSGFHAHAI